MKKGLLSALGSFALLTIVACGGGSTEQAAATPEPTPEATPAPTPEPTPAPTLDGKSFTVTVKIEGQPDATDTFKFDAGTFESAWGVSKGFAKSNYTLADAGNGAWKFATDAESATEGKGHWEGTLSGDKLAGEMVSTKADGTAMKAAFEGTVVAPAAPAGDPAAAPAGAPPAGDAAAAPPAAPAAH